MKRAFLPVPAQPIVFFQPRLEPIEELCRKHKDDPRKLVAILCEHLGSDFQLDAPLKLQWLQDQIAATHKLVFIKLQASRAEQDAVLLYKLLLLETRLALHVCIKPAVYGAYRVCPLRHIVILQDASVADLSIEDTFAYCFLPLARAINLGALKPSVAKELSVKELLDLVQEQAADLLGDAGVLLSDFLTNEFEEKYQQYLGALRLSQLHYDWLDVVDLATVRGVAFEYLMLEIGSDSETEYSPDDAADSFKALRIK